MNNIKACFLAGEYDLLEEETTREGKKWVTTDGVTTHGWGERGRPATAAKSSLEGAGAELVSYQLPS